MNSLFPEEKIEIAFNCTYVKNINGNKKEYHIGVEQGIIRKFNGSTFSGYEFLSENGSKYFISTTKSQIPQNYDAVFTLLEEYEKLTIAILSKCKKKALYIKLPDHKNILQTWEGRFNYKKEVKDETGNITQFGLRPPQIGALHSILSHWSISIKPAVVVMPTGTGKTETMLCLTIAEKCLGLLVVVPSASLRNQIFNKFKSLGILKDKRFQIVSSSAKNPIVGFLKTGIKSIEDANTLFESNVVISTPQIITGILSGDAKIKTAFLNWCNILIMDEAHHSQAKEWNNIKLQFETFNKPILLFTATPFRNDKKRLQGKVIYDYPLSLAQRDNYYKQIVFHPILEFNPLKSDQLIAEKAISILEKDMEEKYDHILMARVDTMSKAEEVFEKIYKPYQKYNPVFIHSGIKQTIRKKILEDIIEGKHKIIVCVDMLGEGFDLPQLKICALHDLHKNITTSFQFFGRFTRESILKLGNASIVANIADPELKGTLKKLYQKDSDWDKIISMANEEIIGSVKEEQDFFQNFSDAEIPAKIPLRNITPAMSTVVFRLFDDEIEWEPQNYRSCFNDEKYETVSVEHEEKNLLVIVAKKVDPVKWGKIDDLLNCQYDLYIIYLNEDQKLLYINSTNNGTTHDKLAEAIVGPNKSLFNEADIYKCLDGVFQLELFNLGLKSTLDGPISFTMYAGNSIVSGLDELDKNTKSSSNLFGVGYENGDKVTIGCSSKGRVWTKLVKSIPDFCQWCDSLGNKLLDDSIDTQDIFKFIQKPELIIELPTNKVPVAMKWNEELYAYTSMTLHKGIPVVDFNVKLKSYGRNYVEFSIESNQNAIDYRMLLDSTIGRGYKYELISSIPFIITYKGDEIDIAELFNDFPPVTWFHDNSKMYNNIFFPFKGKISLFDTSKILTLEWTGTDIRKESQNLEKRTDSIQYHIIEKLKSNTDYKIIFDDDDANEASDIIAIKFWDGGDSRIKIDLYHCKFSSKSQSGGRLKDLYEVCGQAQRSFHWRHTTYELMQHMIRRQNSRINQGKASRYEIGGDEEMNTLVNMITSGYCELEFNIYVVQPGISKRAIEKETEHLKLLGATDLLLKKTGNNFFVMTSE
jgi:superfamily II DNA or RNA helicase